MRVKNRCLMVVSVFVGLSFVVQGIVTSWKVDGTPLSCIRFSRVETPRVVDCLCLNAHEPSHMSQELHWQHPHVTVIHVRQGSGALCRHLGSTPQTYTHARVAAGAIA